MKVKRKGKQALKKCNDVSEGNLKCCCVRRRSSRQEVDRAGRGGTEGVCDETSGCTGGDGQRQEAQGGQGHPLPGSRCTDLMHYTSMEFGLYTLILTKTCQQKYKLESKFLMLSPPGVFDECDTEVDVLHWSRHNVFLLYDMGIFTALLELLSMEIE